MRMDESKDGVLRWLTRNSGSPEPIRMKTTPMTTKRTCSDWRCGWRGEESEILVAPDPFNPGSEITACPKCREIGTTRVACDEPDCWDESTCGTPTPTGYRNTCDKHQPR